MKASQTVENNAVDAWITVIIHTGYCVKLLVQKVAFLLNNWPEAHGFSFYANNLRRVYDGMLLTPCSQDQPPPEGEDSGHKQDEQGEDKKQKENTAYAKKMVLRLAGIMGLGGTVGIVYMFGESSSCLLALKMDTAWFWCYTIEDFLWTLLDSSSFFLDWHVLLLACIIENILTQLLGLMTGWLDYWVDHHEDLENIDIDTNDKHDIQDIFGYSFYFLLSKCFLVWKNVLLLFIIYYYFFYLFLCFTY